MSGWMFEKTWSTSVTGNQMEFDGRYVWVTCSDGIRLFEYWGEASGNEPDWDSYDIFNGGFPGSKLGLFKFIPLAGGCHWIARAGNKMYVSNAATDFDKIYSIDISTWVVSDPISTPEKMNSNICWEYDKLWMVGTHPTSSIADPDQQKMHTFNGSTWSFVYIPQRKSTVRTWVSSPHDGFVYCTSYNNVGVCKFNASTGAYVDAIRVNALPTRMLGTSERELFVSSYAGMLSSINDGTVQNEMSTLGDIAVSVAAEPGGQVFWFVNENNRLGRLNRLDKSIIFSLPKPDKKKTGIEMEDDWTLELGAFSETTFEEVMITPSFKYQVWNGSGFTQKTVYPYLFLLSAGKLHAVRLFNPLYRENYFEINGQAAIVTGDKQYFGETS